MENNLSHVTSLKTNLAALRFEFKFDFYQKFRINSSELNNIPFSPYFKRKEKASY